MLWTPRPEFNKSVISHTGQPGAAVGATITPGNNTYGSYVQVMTALADDAYGILVNINSVAVSAKASDSITTIGFDFSGGTTYGDNTIDHLLCSAADTIGAFYYFPLFIPAGTTIGAKGSINNATVATQRVWCQTFHKPKRPEDLNFGTFVLTVGGVAASSRGTAVTPGTGAEGTWTVLGSSVGERPPWWWQLGVGVNDSTMSATNYHADLSTGDGTNQRMIIENQLSSHTSAEAMSRRPFPGGLSICDVGRNESIYGRLQCDTTPDSAMSMMAYGCG